MATTGERCLTHAASIALPTPHLRALRASLQQASSREPRHLRAALALALALALAPAPRLLSDCLRPLWARG